MPQSFAVDVYEGAGVGYETWFESLDLMDCYDFIEKWCQNKPWVINGPDFHDKSSYNEADLDYSHALRKYW